VTTSIRRLLTQIVLLGVVALPAHAQVQFDTSAYQTPGGVGATCNVPLLIASNPNRALIVGVHTASASVSGVAGAGASWATAPAITRSSASNRVEIWVGTNPTAGSQTVTVTLSTNDTDLICGAESFYGVNQAFPTANPIAGNGTGGTAQIVVSSSPGNMTFALASHQTYFDGPTGCTSATDWFTTPTDNVYGQGTHCAGGATSTFTWATAQNWAIAGLDIQSASSSPFWAGILNPARAINWTTPGVVGGIPARLTQCVTASCNTLAGGTVTSTSINNALNSALADTYVAIPAGTFTLTGGIVFDHKDNVTLRGAGPDRTVLKFTGGGDPCGGQGGDLCFINEEPNDTQNPGNVAPWQMGTGTYNAGTTSITLGARTQGSTNPSVGTLLILDQLDDSNTDNGQLWICQTADICSTQGGIAQGPGSRSAVRGQTQVVRVTAITTSGDDCPCTVTFTPGLYMPNWRDAQQPGAWWSNKLPIKNSGAEDFSMDHSSSTAIAGAFIFNGDGIWLKNIRSINAYAKHVWMYQSVHTTVRDSYFFGTQFAASDSYGTDTFIGGDHLIENNIFEHIASPMVNEGGQGIVHAYNYAIDDFYTKGGAVYWQQASSYQHAIGNAFILWEGNDGIALTADDIHGVSDFITAFRNYWNGRDTQGGAPLPGKTQQTNAIQLQAFNRYYNIIGNVLGTSGYHTNYQVAPSAVDDRGNRDTSNHSVYSLGYCGNEGTRDEIDDCFSTFDNDLTLLSTLMRWGNYDTFTGTRWCGDASNTGWTTRCGGMTEVSTDATYPNPIPPTELLPNSFYRSAKPSWFGTAPWPAIGPDITGGNIANVGGHAKKIPARLCRENAVKMPYDPIYGNTVRLFNATSCYPVP
jgi:hypothetical protein